MSRKAQLADQVAIVTGASRGIGRATALALAREGARVVLAARDAADLQEVARAVTALGREAFVVPTDVTSQEQVKALVQAALDRWGRVDMLVVSAGTYLRRPAAEVTVADVEQAMQVNFYGALYPILAVRSHMLDRKRGHIVLISSMDAKKGLPLDAPYVASKCALTGVGEVMRQELRDRGVQVTMIFPGRVESGMIADLKVPWISPKISVEAVARAVVRGIHRRKPEVILPFRARGLVYLNALSPRLGDWLVRLFHLQGWKRDAPVNA